MSRVAFVPNMPRWARDRGLSAWPRSSRAVELLTKGTTKHWAIFR